ncbi:hypothetical protein SLEP1_g54630 [Rubroshorea leprosula]|uniref:Uncharacterized protein n=1 Tax=Rubroshorea leprosula TaxID=152421 RepID=A0AAV5MDJ7_9ROSI|nr:hypothetical protein SLEP1_g54630 [Rubroshorea leprosula]
MPMQRPDLAEAAGGSRGCQIWDPPRATPPRSYRMEGPPPNPQTTQKNNEPLTRSAGESESRQI